jgi:hypothetical protein
MDKTTDELLKRRGELAYQAQMAALESLTVPAEDDAEGRAIDAELKRRGVDLLHVDLNGD